jgi:hypothetical protein
MTRIRTEGLAAVGTELTMAFLSRRGCAHRNRVELALRSSVLNAVWSCGTVGDQGSHFAYQKQWRRTT